MSVPVIKGATGLDVVAAVPYCLGFEPEDCVVAVALMPPRGRLGPMWRADQRGLRDAHVGPDLTTTLAAMLQEVGAQGVFLIRYAPPGAPVASRDPGLRAVQRALRGGPRTEAVWDVVGDTLCELHPVDLTPLGDVHGVAALAETQTRAQFQAIGAKEPLGRRSDLTRFDPPPEAAARAARRAERRALDKLSRAGQEAELTEWRLEAIALWRELVEQLRADPAVALEPAVLGRAGAALYDCDSRDAVVALHMKEAADWPERLASGRAFLPPLLDPEVSEGVDPALVDTTDRLFREIIAYQPPRRRARALTAFATVQWWAGNGAATQELAAAALRCPEPPSFAEVLLCSAAAMLFPRVLKARAEAGRGLARGKGRARGTVRGGRAGRGQASGRPQRVA
ncbi:MAG: DUF4192 domain-containing protein [Bifidobacteriaceae bacterium]|jgi:hypothetical protein|nr:DUF4192 domain-containing protein [Bifidobacteriaceae bacterium]